MNEKKFISRKYKCTESLRMDNGMETFTKGRVYKSINPEAWPVPCDICFTDNLGFNHFWDFDSMFHIHFSRVRSGSQPIQVQSE